MFIVTGPRSAGKSSVSAMLANKLGWEFLDSDRLVQIGLCERGYTLDSAMRRREFGVIEDVLADSLGAIGTKGDRVLALAGGALRYQGLRDIIWSSAAVCIVPGDGQATTERVLFEREVTRPHFMGRSVRSLEARTRADYSKVMADADRLGVEVLYYGGRSILEVSELLEIRALDC